MRHSTYWWNLRGRTVVFFALNGVRRNWFQGDSGAPLVCNSQLAGIAAFNTGCTIPGYPGVYVKISSKAIYEWIMINL